ETWKALGKVGAGMSAAEAAAAVAVGAATAASHGYEPEPSEYHAARGTAMGAEALTYAAPRPSAAAYDDALEAERAVQCQLLRCVFGNPFHPVHIDAAWLAGTVVQLARAIYEERKWEEMGVLGDALEEAGCDNDDILSHCRGKGPHARGCWVVDALLGKS